MRVNSRLIFPGEPPRIRCPTSKVTSKLARRRALIANYLSKAVGDPLFRRKTVPTIPPDDKIILLHLPSPVAKCRFAKTFLNCRSPPSASFTGSLASSRERI